MAGEAGWGSYDAREALERLNMGNVVEISSRDAGRLTDAMMKLDPNLTISLREENGFTFITKLTRDEMDAGIAAGADIKCRADDEVVDGWVDELRHGKELKVQNKYAKAICELIVRHEPTMLVMAEKRDDGAVIRVITREEANRIGGDATRLQIDVGPKGRYLN